MEFREKWIPSKNAVHDEKGKCICITYENKTANALLISKAPEMLEMLNELISVKSSSFILDELQDRARQLIKEATEL